MKKITREWLNAANDDAVLFFDYAKKIVSQIEKTLTS